MENSLEGSDELLRNLKHEDKARLVGITGPPGAGKSTLVNALLEIWVKADLQVAVIAVDPSSPFHFGSLLGDRIRMTKFFNHPQVFIRSLASRGALGGLHPRIYEITDVVAEAGFDIILLETVGVGQSEVEIAGIADCTIVSLVPEAGDMIQTMKAGLLEIADVFVVNKSDREDADVFYRNLRVMVHERNLPGHAETPVLKTVANTGAGLPELSTAVLQSLKEANQNDERRKHLRLQKAWHLIQEERMKNLSKKDLESLLAQKQENVDFNIYAFSRSVAQNGISS